MARNLSPVRRRMPFGPFGGEACWPHQTAPVASLALEEVEADVDARGVRDAVGRGVGGKNEGKD